MKENRDRILFTIHILFNFFFIVSLNLFKKGREPE